MNTRSFYPRHFSFSALFSAAKLTKPPQIATHRRKNGARRVIVASRFRGRLRQARSGSKSFGGCRGESVPMLRNSRSWSCLRHAQRAQTVLASRFAVGTFVTPPLLPPHSSSPQGLAASLLRGTAPSLPYDRNWWGQVQPCQLYSNSNLNQTNRLQKMLLCAFNNYNEFVIIYFQAK